MFSKLSRPLQVFYSLILLAITIGLSFILFNYWNAGLFDGSKLSSIHEVSYKVQEIKSKKLFESIDSLSNKTKTRSAQQEFDYLKNDLKLINSNLRIIDNDELVSDINNVQGKLKVLNSMPRMEEVLSIFSTKLSKFISYVQFNKWRTLTRVSKRVKTRVPTIGRVNVKNLSKRIRSILQDISIMSKVTEGSVLTVQEKNSIAQKLTSLKTEIMLSQKYLDSYSPYSKSWKNFRDKYKRHLKDVEPNIALSRLKIVESSKKISMGIFLIACFCIVMLITGFMLYRREKKRHEGFVEERLMVIIKRGLLASSCNIDASISSKTKNEVLKAHEFLQKRMRFGQIFECTLPFSSILLDSNLKVVWGNEHFFTDWNMSDSKDHQTHLDWDSLRKLTNLGETDPVYDANRNGVAGIFQIQVNLKNSTKTQASPYEMYVHPVDINGDRNIMVYFYPLSALEESFAEQVRTIESPIRKFVAAVTTNKFKGDDREQLSSEFNNAGLHEVYSGLESYYEQSTSQQQNLMTEIHKLEQRQEEILSLVNEIEQIHKNKKEGVDQGITYLGSTKKDLIRYVELNSRHEESYGSIFQGLKSILKNYTALLKKAEEFHRSLKENLDVIESITSMKSEFKQEIINAKEYRLRLKQAVDQTLHFGKTRTSEPDRLGINFKKIETNANGLDTHMSELEKAATTFDLNLTKAQMLVEGNHRFKNGEEAIENLFEDFKGISYKIEHDMKNLQNSFSQNKALEEKIVENLTVFDQYFSRSVSEDNHVIDLSQKVNKDEHSEPARVHHAEGNV